MMSARDVNRPLPRPPVPGWTTSTPVNTNPLYIIMLTLTSHTSLQTDIAGVLNQHFFTAIALNTVWELLSQQSLPCNAHLVQWIVAMVTDLHLVEGVVLQTAVDIISVFTRQLMAHLAKG